MIRISLKLLVTLLVMVVYTFILLIMVLTTFRKEEVMGAIKEALDEFNKFWGEK